MGRAPVDNFKELIFPRARLADEASSRSIPFGRRDTDDGCPTHQWNQDEHAIRAVGLAETFKGKKAKTSRSTYDVCEVFSPSRVSKFAGQSGPRGGWSLDVAHVCAVTGRMWDALKPDDREWCRRMVHRDRPRLLVVCPPCTLFSRLQHLSPNGLPEVRCPERWRQAIEMVKFAVELCNIQRRAGRIRAPSHIHIMGGCSRAPAVDERARGIRVCP